MESTSLTYSSFCQYLNQEYRDSVIYNRLEALLAFLQAFLTFHGDSNFK